MKLSFGYHPNGFNRFRLAHCNGGILKAGRVVVAPLTQCRATSCDWLCFNAERVLDFHIYCS